MDKFLQRYNLSRLNQRKIENMIRLITRNEIESVVLKLLTNGFTGEVYQIFREELTPILLKPFQKNCRGRNTSELTL